MSLFDTGIRPAIDNYLTKKAAEERDYGNYWSASSAGYCMRLNILKRLKVPSVPEIAEDALRTQRVFECGHIFHEWMQRITKDAGLSIAQELDLQDEDLLIRGHFDDLILVSNRDAKITEKSDTKVVISESANLILYDYKTANSQSFNYKRDEIGHYHKMQLGTYLYMLNKATAVSGWDGNLDEERGGLFLDFVKSAQDIKEARIMQISKDDLRMREQQLMWSPDLEEQVIEYWRTLQSYWDRRVLPPCTCLDHDGGFMGRRSKKGKVYNPFFYNDTPCSEEWIRDKLPPEWSSSKSKEN